MEGRTGCEHGDGRRRQQSWRTSADQFSPEQTSRCSSRHSSSPPAAGTNFLLEAPRTRSRQPPRSLSAGRPARPPPDAQAGGEIDSFSLVGTSPVVTEPQTQHEHLVNYQTPPGGLTTQGKDEETPVFVSRRLSSDLFIRLVFSTDRTPTSTLRPPGAEPPACHWLLPR